MNKTILTRGQQELAEENLYVVPRVIHKYIIVNDSLFGFEYEDLYQEGCVWLCKAAASFREEMGAPFSAYAEKVVTNGLRTYCRLMYGKQQRVCIIPLHADLESDLFALDQIPDCRQQDAIIAEADTMQLLHDIKQQYTGTVWLGIEAIELKIKGYSGKEIAAMYGIKPNLVGAWISRAKNKLKQNDSFMGYFQYPTEKAS